MSTSREKAIESAKELFSKKGYLNTSVDEILVRAGITKSNLYYHFKSKEELGLVALDEIIADYKNEFLTDTIDNKSLSPEERLNRFYKRIISRQKTLECKRGSVPGNLASELSDVNENFRFLLSGFFTNCQKTIEACIKEGVKSKAFRSDIASKDISQLIISHLEGAVLISKTGRSAKPLKSGSKTILKLIRR